MAKKIVPKPTHCGCGRRIPVYNRKHRIYQCLPCFKYARRETRRRYSNSAKHRVCRVRYEARPGIKEHIKWRDVSYKRKIKNMESWF